MIIEATNVASIEAACKRRGFASMAVEVAHREVRRDLKSAYVVMF